jgi:hypothetical protein
MSSYVYLFILFIYSYVVIGGSNMSWQEVAMTCFRSEI